MPSSSPWPASRSFLALVAALVLALWNTACTGTEGTAGDAPHAAFAHERTGTGMQVRFDASESSGAGERIVSFAWDFGDGARASGREVTHAFSGAGAYAVELTVSDASGRTGRTSDTVRLASVSGTVTIDGAAPRATWDPVGADPGAERAGGEDSQAVRPVPTIDGTGTREAQPAHADFALSANARTARFVPGEAIVRFAPRGSMRRIAPPASLDEAGFTVRRVRSLALPAAALYRAPASDRRSTLALIDALNRRSDVVYAHPNYIVEPFRAPSDALYPLMWHFDMIGLEEAWDITTGASDVVVAVLDTGMLMSHPDRPQRLLAGYDFVSDPSNGDGDGRDSDPTDPGPFTDTEYHGTHVAGIVAARANHDYDGRSGADGIAGVTWNASLLPVRVLGPSAPLSDILDGLLWAAGASVQGAPTNPDPARIVNLSLGTNVACSDVPAYQDAVDSVTAEGVTVVAAAGNGNVAAAGVTPASCAGVIAVGASTIEDRRAGYSNWGAAVDLVAPGGNPTGDVNGDGYLDGVLSLSKTRDAFDHVFSVGTSMAAPHVVGTIALMLDANPSLEPADVRAILADTAVPYSDGRCDANDPDHVLRGEDCGAGRLDAYAAVLAARSYAAPPPSGDGELSFAPDPVAFGSTSTSASATLANTGAATLSWRLLYAEEDPSNPADLVDGVISAGPLQGTLAPGASQSMTLRIDRTELHADGAYALDLAFDTDGNASTAEAFLSVTFQVDSDGTDHPSGSMVVEALLDLGQSYAYSGGVSSTGPIGDYTFSAAAGSNFVYAWSDENGNERIDAGDYFGAHDAHVDVESGREHAGVDIHLELVQTPEAVRASLPERIPHERIPFEPLASERIPLE